MAIGLGVADARLGRLGRGVIGRRLETGRAHDRGVAL
jgi:hypothetical protein